MHEILKKRCADLTVLEVLQFGNMKARLEKPFIDMSEFVKVSGLERRKIHSLLDNDLSGVRELVFGGYDNYKKYNFNKKICFETTKVLEWLKNR